MDQNRGDSLDVVYRILHIVYFNMLNVFFVFEFNVHDSMHKTRLRINKKNNSECMMEHFC